VLPPLLFGANCQKNQKYIIDTAENPDACQGIDSRLN